MIVTIGSITLYYPYNEISPEQIQTMFILYKLWGGENNGIIGIPPAIDLPITVISFFLSSNLESKQKIRLLYVSQTANETEKVFRNLEDYHFNFKDNKMNLFRTISNISSFSEKNKLCIHRNFKKYYKEEELEDFCLSMILPQKKVISAKKKVKNIKKSKKGPLGYQKCIYFENFEKKKIRKKSGLWNITNIRKEAQKKKICPFYFSKEMIFDSEIILIDSKKFFSTEISDINLKKLLKTSLLVIDSLKNFDSILGDFAVSEINSLFIKDSLRGLLYLRKKILNLSYRKFSYLKDRFPVKNFSNLNFLKLLTDRKKEFFVNENTYEKLNSLRILNLINILKKISEFFLSIFTKKIELNTSLDQFFNVLLCALKNSFLNSSYLLHFNYYIILLSFMSGTLEYRYLTGLKYLGLFLLKSGMLLESKNENFRLMVLKKSTSSKLITETSLCLCCFEIPVFSRLIFENAISFLIFTTQNSFLCSNLNIFDQKKIYFGNLKSIFRKCFLSYQEIVIKKNFNTTNTKKINQKNLNFSKKIISVLSQISESSPTGILCLFSSYSTLLEVIKVLKDPSTFKKMKNKRNIFIEIFFSKLDLNVVEEYKLSCDLGIKSVFLGLLDGIISKTNLENYYSRIILKIDSNSIYSNKFKKIYFFYKKFFYSKFSFYRFFENIENYNQNLIFRKFFGSKKDYGIVVNLIQIQNKTEKQEKLFMNTTNDQKIFKEEGLSLVQKVDRFFYYCSTFNIGV